MHCYGNPNTCLYPAAMKKTLHNKSVELCSVTESPPHSLGFQLIHYSAFSTS